MVGFEEGYTYFEKNASAYVASTMSDSYVASVNDEIEKLVNDLNSFENFKTSSNVLKGDVAEFWHTGTYNIDSALKGSSNRAFVDRSHDFASTDISTNYGDKYGLKYYSDGQASAKAQAVSVFQRFKEYQSHGGTDNKGAESIPLSKKEAEVLAKLAKQGKINADDLGLTTEELIKYDYIVQQAFKAGLTAATISVVLKVAPEIIKAIDYLIKNGEINAVQFKKIGFAAVSGGAEGFIRGSVSAALTASCKAGLLGETLKSVDPTIVGTVTVLTINVIKNAFQVALGNKSTSQLTGELVRDMYISTCSLIGGGISQAFIEVPVLGYMIGSFVGSIIGSFTYNVGHKAIVSFCVDSGFTMFGLVEQDYTLPKEVIEQMGIETFDYETFHYDTFEPESFSFDSFETDTFEPDTLDVTFLRRGVIGVSKVGYVL